MQTLKRLAVYLFATLFGIAIGGASALYLAGLWPGAKPLDFGDVDVDGWRSDFAIGSEAADPYTRARVARHGLLALAKSEAVYFTRTTDMDGRPLSDGCTYLVAGTAMPAAWWSITLYNAASMLPENDDGAPSVDATSITKRSDGSWSAIVSPKRPEDAADWISSRNAGTFDLILRLYVPDGALLESPEETLIPPTIDRLSCEGQAL